MKNSNVTLTNIDKDNHVYTESVEKMCVKSPHTPDYYGVFGSVSHQCYLLTPDEDTAEKMCGRFETDH